MYVSLPSQGTHVRLLTGGLHLPAEPLLLLPGLGGSGQRDFSALLPVIARTRPVVALDFSCHADRQGQPLQLENLVGQTAAVLNAVFPGRATVVLGQSLGAAVALALAATEEQIAALVLVSGWLTTTNSIHAYHELCKQNAALMPQWLGRLASLIQVSPAFLNSTSPDRVAMRLQPSDPVVFRDQLQLLAGLDLEAAAAKVQVPALVVAGTEDLLAGRQQSELLLGAISGACYREIKAGHLVSVERPAELDMVLARFLQTLTTGQETHEEPPRNRAELFKGARK